MSTKILNQGGEGIAKIGDIKKDCLGGGVKNDSDLAVSDILEFGLEVRGGIAECIGSHSKKKYFSLEELRSVEKLGLSQPAPDSQKWFPTPKEGEVNTSSRINIDNIRISETYLNGLYLYLDKALDDFSGFNLEKCKGFVVALSGGLDSAILVKILNDYCTLKRKEMHIVIMGTGEEDSILEKYQGMPAEWLDIQFARNLCRDLKLNYEYLDISDDLNVLQRRYKTSWAISGQRPRVRANHLNAIAEEHDLISVGSTNGTEFILAAFSVGGPAGNISPLIDLYKSEVYAIARDVGVPEYILKRKPLISEMNVSDYSLYGGGEIDCMVLDPIIRRLWFKKETPEMIAKALGHGERWIKDILEKRIKGEACRRSYGGFTINRVIMDEAKDSDLVIDRSYFL